MDNFNIKKLEEEAFNTIDDIFSDDEDKSDSSLYDNMGKNDDIKRLEEKMLSLDWEFSHKDLSDVIDIIQSLQQQYADNISKVLLTMMTNISKFIMDTRENAPSDSLALLAQVLDTFKKVNDDKLDDSKKKEKLKNIYAIFTIFKQNLSARTKHTKHDDVESDGIETPDMQENDISPEKQVSPEEEVISEKDILSESDTLQEEKILQLEEVLSADEILPDDDSLSDDEVIPGDEYLSEDDDTSVDSIAVSSIEKLADPQIISSQYGAEIGSRLVSLEKKVDFIISTLTKMTGSDFSGNEQEINEIQYADVNVKAAEGLDDPVDLHFGQESDQSDMEYEQIDTQSDQTYFNSEPDLMDDSDSNKSVPPETLIDEMENIPYVLIFSLDDKLLAFPYEFILNIYSVSTVMAKKMLQSSEVPLKKLKGFMKPLKKNMRGSLRVKSERELQKLMVVPKSISLTNENTSYSNAVLVDCGDRYNLIFVGKQKSTLVYLPNNSNAIDTGNEITAEVEIEGGESALLINPCQ